MSLIARQEQYVVATIMILTGPALLFRGVNIPVLSALDVSKSMAR